MIKYKPYLHVYRSDAIHIGNFFIQYCYFRDSVTEGVINKKNIEKTVRIGTPGQSQLNVQFYEMYFC